MGVDAVAHDVHRRALHQPGVAVEAAAFVPPALKGVGIDPHRDHVGLVAIAGEGGHVDVAGRIAAPVVRHDVAVEPDGGGGGDAVELDLQVLALVGGIQAEAAAVPGHALGPVALGDVGGRLERPLHHEVVRQVHEPPRPVVVVEPRRAAGRPGLGRGVGLVAAVRDRRRDIAAMEAPREIQRQPLAGTPRRRRGRLGSARSAQGKRRPRHRRAGGKACALKEPATFHAHPAPDVSAGPRLAR
jgi:hypothetical protein